MANKGQSTLVISSLRVELVLGGTLILLGTALRAWRLSTLGLIHFDEGVYAISGLWTITPGLPLYTNQTLFSPPLFFSLVGASYWLLGGASDKAVILVSVVIGGLTVALVWWLTRRWFGRAAGIAAAALVALSEFHIAYSRMALTDITFGFLYLLSLASIAVTIEKGSFRWAFLSGLVVGAACNTKYHGWLPLLVALTALVPFAVFGRYKGAFWKRRVMCWIVIAAVAAVCYLPWLIYVQSQPGGYLSLLQYQRGYLSWRNWLSNLWQHVEMQLFLDGWLSRFSPAMAFLLALVVHRNRWWSSWHIAALLVLALIGSGLVVGGVGTAIMLSFLAIPSLMRRSSYPDWLVLSSLGFLFLSTPLYHPYPRLLLPWILSVYIAAGAGIEWILVDRTASWSESVSRPSRRSLSPLLVAATVLLAATGLVVAGSRPAPRTWMATDSLREAAVIMARTLPGDSKVFVHGGPEVAFYLQLAGCQAIPIDYPIDHPEVTTRFNTNGENVYLVTGVYGQHRDPSSRSSLERLASRLQLVGIFPMQPNDVRLLNDFSPGEALRYRLQPTNEFDLHLYKVSPVPEQTS